MLTCPPSGANVSLLDVSYQLLFPLTAKRKCYLPNDNLEAIVTPKFYRQILSMFPAQVSKNFAQTHVVRRLNRRNFTSPSSQVSLFPIQWRILLPPLVLMSHHGICMSNILIQDEGCGWYKSLLETQTLPQIKALFLDDSCKPCSFREAFFLLFSIVKRR